MEYTNSGYMIQLVYMRLIPSHIYIYIFWNKNMWITYMTPLGVLPLYKIIHKLVSASKTHPKSSHPYTSLIFFRSHVFVEETICIFVEILDNIVIVFHRFSRSNNSKVGKKAWNCKKPRTKPQIVASFAWSFWRSFSDLEYLGSSICRLCFFVRKNNLLKGRQGDATWVPNILYIYSSLRLSCKWSTISAPSWMFGP